VARRPWYFNVSRVRLERVVRRFADRTPPGTLVLDAGAGTGVYRRLFTHTRYESADFAKLSTRYTPLDYVCDLSSLPVEDERFGAVLCTQVFEHLPEPGAVARELFRVLEPGGELVCSAPFAYREHQQPYDFYRYTRYGLRHVFEAAGFEVDRVVWLEGFFGTIAYQLDAIARGLPRDPRTVTRGRRLAYVAPLLVATRLGARFLSGAFARADLRWKYTGGGHPKNYVLVAFKPRPADPAAGDR
jgi:SAM-dependent methyltransferase